MGQSPKKLSTLRRARVESFEARMMMSAQSPAAQLAQQAKPVTDGLVQPQTTASSAYSFTGLASERATYGLTGAGQTVAVIDTGIAYDHSALGGGYGAGNHVVGGYDFTTSTNNPFDFGPTGGHGTHVAGIIGSTDASNPGVAPGADLVSLRVFDNQGNGSFAAVDLALKWVHANRNAFRNPITTVNLSLGADWNSNTVPNWANLETDFLQLKNDGIFIAVAAGNNFASYNTPGLSYPGVSPYVVPVAAVDESGNLAGYSQRLDRVIAAPGTNIRSTAPDYIGNLDGKDNDWITMSGTSMATPYVAGASVLIRQAMQLAGYKNISEDAIVGVMRSTADSIYDAVTHQSYSRLNVLHAIDSILAADDIGDTASTARDLGTIVTGASVSSTINRTSDKDFFSFVAGQSGTVTFTATTDAGMSPRWEIAGTTGTTSSNSLTLNVVAGQRYTIGFSSASGIGHYRLDATAAMAATNWGAIDFKQIAGLNLSSGNNWYAATASQTGIFTVQAIFAQAGGAIDVEVYGANNQLLGHAWATSYGQRLDISVAAGQTLYVHIKGVNPAAQFRLANLVSQAGTTVNISGTSGDDTLVYAAGATQQVTINGIDYQFASSAVTKINFDGGAGNDSIQLTGTSGNESATIRPGSATFSGAGFTVQANSVERIAVDGNGGSDQATLYGSAGNDTLDLTPTTAHLYGSGYDITTRNFAAVTAYATAGGGDTVNFRDSAGDDKFYGAYGSARETGAGYQNLAIGFQFVNAYSSGGNDVAYLYDSPGNDVYLASPTWQRMMSGGNQTQTNGFKLTYAYANSGGNDSAYLYDSAGDDQFVGFATWSAIAGNGYKNIVSGFRFVSVAASTGNDTAFLHDSPGIDALYMASTWSAMIDGSTYYQVNSFRTVTGYSYNGGQDIVNLYDGAGDNYLSGANGTATLSGSSFKNQAVGFSQMNAYANSGATDTADMSAVDYLFNLLGKWSKPKTARV